MEDNDKMRDDHDLVTEFIKGNVRSFDELVLRYQKVIYYIALRMVNHHEDANEIAQRVFIKVYNGLHKFKYKSSLKTWLYKITINTCKNFLRDSSKAQLVELNNEDLKTNSDTEQDLVKNEKQRKIKELLQGLSNKQKTTVVLRIYEELTFDEISKIMKCSIGTAKANFHNAVKNLKEMLEKEDKDDV